MCLLKTLAGLKTRLYYQELGTDRSQPLQIQGSTRMRQSFNTADIAIDILKLLFFLFKKNHVLRVYSIVPTVPSTISHRIASHATII